MAASITNFSAAPSAAGYLYQARLALALCLKYVNTEAGIEVGIERLDDVSFESQGTALELLQAKHHIDRVASLTDKSVDLWKTLRVWSEAAAKDPTLPARTRLALVTTGSAPDDSAAAHLRPARAYSVGKARDPKAAAALLVAVAEAGSNQELKAAYAAFLALSPTMRISLLSSIEILDNQPLVTDLGEVIENDLRMLAPRGQTIIARERLEGWWWPRVCKALMARPAEPISVLEVEAKLDDIRDGLKRDALVADQEHVDPTTDEIADYEGRPFVRQLKVVGVGGNRIEYAKRDYYRAFTQRSKWVREHLVFDGEIAKYELTLIEEWQPRFQQMRDKIGGETTDAARRQAGQELYSWVEADARFPFRKVSQRFLTVGSYHILANDLRVGWHPDYETACIAEEV
ncbi:ABC-three component system protein [Xanthobacter variabilis]|uniref:ABC-three component system protein n=1 Tax=Xanthobacter variabilis TaxID=3119932 RepID=UPI0037279457